MTPGEYLRKRRLCAGILVDQIAAPARDIEAGTAPITVAAVLAYQAHVAMDRDILFALVDGAEPQLCRVCGCSWHDPCLDDHGQGCAWAEPDLCTACPKGALDVAQAA